MKFKIGLSSIRVSCKRAVSEVCNFADNLTFHACDNDLNTLIMRLEHDASLVMKWFENSNMKINKDKCHLLVYGDKYGIVWVKMGRGGESKEC